VTAPPTQPALAAYVVAANAVCEQSFGKSQAVNLTADQQLANSLATRAQSAALEVTTAEGLLALPLPPDPAVVPLPLALTGYRDAYAAIGAAAKDDGRTVEARGAAVAGVEGAAIQPSAASGAIMQAIGATRCAAWLNPNGLKDTGAN
jgi:hypothetical protein